MEKAPPVCGILLSTYIQLDTPNVIGNYYILYITDDAHS